MRTEIKSTEFEGTIGHVPYKFYAEIKSKLDLIYISIYRENDEEFNSKDDPKIILVVDSKKRDIKGRYRWDTLREIGGLDIIAATEFDKIITEAINQLGIEPPQISS